MKKIIILLALVLIMSFATALSQGDVVDLVAKQNNYLLDSESAVVYKPTVTISYENDNYWVVAGIQDETVAIYLPINNDTGELASGEIEKRELIETEIVLSKIYQLKNSAYGTSWPFTHSMKSSFYDYQRVFNDMILNVINVQTELEAISGTGSLVVKADNVRASFEALGEDAETIAELIEESRLFEEDYFDEPDTNQTSDYEEYLDDYFSLVDAYKTDYYSVEGAVTELKTEIASFQGDMESNQKEFFFNSLSMPVETDGLKSFFGFMDQIKTLVEGVFSQGKNVEVFIGNLETRKARNGAWQVIYATNEKLSQIEPKYQIENLADAAALILSSENINYWKEQESVDALQTNWTQAESRYSKGDYAKSQNFAEKAIKNAEDILEGKFIETTDEIPQDLIVQIVIVLIAILVIVFIFEKVVKKKKEETEEGYENYEEYESEKP